MEAKLYGQNKGGMSINGIIKDYYAYAGENISAGDFVEYIKGIADKTDYGVSAPTQLSNIYVSAHAISAVLLDNTHVFIAHSYGNNNYYLYGMVCTINGTSITYGTDTQLSTTKYTAYNNRVNTKLLDTGKILITFGNKQSAPQLAAMVCTINGTTITAGTETILNLTDWSGATTSIEILESKNKIFIAYNVTSESLWGMIVTVSGTTITVNTNTQLDTTTYSGHSISTYKLPNGNIFIAHSYGESYYLYGTIYKITGDTISLVNSVALNTNASTGSEIKAVPLVTGDIFIVHTYSTQYLYATLISITGNTITKHTAVQIGAKNYGVNINACALPYGGVFITHTIVATLAYLYGLVCNIENKTISKGTDKNLNTTQGTGHRSFPLLLPNETLFIAHSSNGDPYYLYSQVFAVDYENNIPTNNVVVTKYETQVRKVTTGQFDGIAKTSGEGGDDTGHNDLVKVWTTPKIIKGNLFPTSWNVETEGTKYSSDDGFVLESSSTVNTTYTANLACNGISNSDQDRWTSAHSTVNDMTAWLIMTLPTSTKITKMNIRVGGGTGFKDAVIQGSTDNSKWVELYTISEKQTSLNEITLKNTDYYKYYRIYFELTEAGTFGVVYEWQTAEYAVLK